MPRRRNKVVQKEGPSEVVTNSATAVDELLTQVDKYVDEFEYDVARGLCERALRINENHVRALETYSSIVLELGKFKKAKECLLKAVSLCPDVGHVKYFSLAQLSDGNEAVNLYKKGIELLKNEIQLLEAANSTSSSESKNCAALKRKLSNAFCAIVELYTTDLCDEEDAEQQCHSNIDQAILTDESNPEAYQCKANLVMIRNNVEEAKQLITKSLSLWLPKAEENSETPSTEACPLSYEARLNCSKLLIELKEFENAERVLYRLINEDDECVEAWYLSGLNYYLREDRESNENKKDAKYFLKEAKQVYNKVGGADEEVIAHIEEMLEELKDFDEEEDNANDEENKENEDDSDIESDDDEEEEMEP